ncbi:MAG: alpha/beta hydrolase family protein [Chthoniobacterales bacterium]
MTDVLIKTSAWIMDGAMCAMMNRLQWQLRDHTCTKEEFDAYVEACRPYTAESFYLPAVASSTGPTLAKPHRPRWPEMVAWPSPHLSGFAENDTARALFFSADGDWSRPTVILLHALMSASDVGYRKLARAINQRGWNAVFPHLPFHYSRVPRGFKQGSLAISSNLPRNAESLRQGVTEIRQIMACLRAAGANRFGLLGTSYGGWTAALAAPLEPDIHFVALVQPIVDLEHVIWESPVAAGLRRAIHSRGIRPGESADHSHLSSPMHATPPSAPHRLIVSGEFDSISPVRPLRELQRRWGATELVTVRQGHFGYRALAAAKDWMMPLLAATD